MRLIILTILVIMVVFSDPKAGVFAAFDKNFTETEWFERCENKEDDLFPVVNVSDGDTILISDGCEPITVRMIGIDTPETVDPRKPVQCFGPESSDYSKAVLKRSNVDIELEPNSEKFDKYGRLLGYVILEDGTNFNQNLLENGFAREYSYGGVYKYRQEFLKAQSYAKENKVGLWADNSCI